MADRYPETIVGVALALPRELVVSLPAPSRHHHILRLIYEAGISDPGADAQGFLTSAGRFVDRGMGLNIATAASQVKVKHGNPHMLFSEDLW